MNEKFRPRPNPNENIRGRKSRQYVGNIDISVLSKPIGLPTNFGEDGIAQVMDLMSDVIARSNPPKPEPTARLTGRDFVEIAHMLKTRPRTLRNPDQPRPKNKS